MKTILQSAFIKVLIVFLSTFHFSGLTLSDDALKHFNAGKISSGHTDDICPSVCKANGRFWLEQAIIKNNETLCICSKGVATGPIWDNEDAKRKCPAVCKSQNQEWDGNWRTVKDDEISTCDCK